MVDRSPNSRSSSRHTQSMILPPIERNSPDRSSNIPDDYNSPASYRPVLRSTSELRRSNNDVKFLIDKLEFIERALEEERRGRCLLEDHFRAIVINVQRLSKDMATLQQQVRSDDINVHSQRVAMKNLELHQMAGIGDVWNRLTLGDLNNIKLSGDLNKVTGEASDLKRGQEDIRRTLDKLQNVVDGLVTKLEKVNLDFEKNLHVLKVKSETQNQGIDEKMKRIEEMTYDYDGSRHTRVEHQLVEQHYSELLSNIEQRLDTLQDINKTWQVSFEERVAKLEDRLGEVSETKNKKEDDMVKRIREVSVNQRTAFKKSQEKQHGNREAFRAVYESITTMQTVLETKLKLTEADLKTSINSILRSLSHN